MSPNYFLIHVVTILFHNIVIPSQKLIMHNLLNFYQTRIRNSISFQNISLILSSKNHKMKVKILILI
ncbi:hypothetical protein RhiirA4_232256 [Rhizophagus irregularis]|uniref:Uncharacterized protein n=1 Tax=Rhizophagus irregularis TaxID=588596 RepID=A0A2I1GPZ3_9GLOM|nr:hypothetical protein RhiirA4_232256 [Rhizophagus irregularis]